MAKVLPSIPQPTPQNSVDSINAIKQVLEILTKQRGPSPRTNAAVTFQDLVDLGLIPASKVPL